jgi:deoxyadenosine/deoxycytidine kinase
VLKRPIYSDFIFANAMRAKNYISAECKLSCNGKFLIICSNLVFKRYYYVRKMSIQSLKFWPHVLIYLDCPVSKCLENIKKRGNASFSRFIVHIEYFTK